MLDDNREVVVEAAIARLELLFSNASFPEDPWTRVLEGWFDPVMPFEKFEGHPSRKARERRFRIVTCLSLVDQLVERVLYSDFVNVVKEDFPNSGVVIGIGFTDTQSRMFAEVAARDGLYSTDISGMDRSLDASYPRACIERRCDDLGPGFSAYKRAMRRENECTLDPVFAVLDYSCARLYVGERPKGMLSGRFVTTYFNSDMRCDMAFLAGAQSVKACGDDCLEFHDDGANLVDTYSSLGFKLRDPLRLDDKQIEFCSHSYDANRGWVCSLSSWPKALHRLCTRKVGQVHIDAFLHEVRHNENFAELSDLIHTPGVLHLA